MMLLLIKLRRLSKRLLYHHKEMGSREQALHSMYSGLSSSSCHHDYNKVSRADTEERIMVL